MGNTEYLENEDDFEDENILEWFPLCSSEETKARKETLVSRMRELGEQDANYALIRVDEAEFNGNKRVFSASSLYFRDLFNRSSSLGQREFTITGVSPETMFLIIQYMYAQEISVTIYEARTLLVTASYLSIPDLVCNCCRFMKTHLNLENCLDIWTLTRSSSYNELRQWTLLYVLHHLEDVVWSPYTKFLEMDVEDLGDILKGEEPNIEQEKTALQAVIRWIKHKPSVRTRHIRILLLKVRLALLTPEYLTEHLNANLLMSSVLEFQPIIAKAMETREYANSAGPETRLPVSFTRQQLPYFILFAFGGFNGTFSTYTVETYDSRLDNWMSISSTEPRSRAHHGTAFLDGSVYIIGGLDKMEYCNTMLRFNPRDRRWNEVVCMNSRRCFVSVAVLDGYIYAMGGFDGIERLYTAERYKPGDNNWSFIPSMHVQRSDSSAATLNGRIYICGGFSGITTLSTAECFDPGTNQWTLIKPMHACRSGLGVVTLNDQVFVIGGFDGTCRLKSVEAFDPHANNWRLLHPMINPRSNFGVEVMDGCLYVVGGKSGNCITSKCECYDEGADQWFHIRDLNIPRHAPSCCVVPQLHNVRD